MVFQQMHLDTERRNFICSGSGNFRSINSVTQPWIVIFVGRNINHGKDCFITSEICITVRMFSLIVTNTNLNMQQNLQKKKHVNVCFALDTYAKQQWKNITWKSIKGILRALSANFAVENIEKRNSKIILRNIIYILEVNIEARKVRRFAQHWALRCYTSDLRSTSREA